MSNSTQYLTGPQIAQKAYEAAYMPDMQKYLDGLIKRNVTHAIALLVEKNKLVLKTESVDAWKVATSKDLLTIQRMLQE